MSSMPQNPTASVQTAEPTPRYGSLSPVLNTMLIEQYAAMDDGVSEDALLPKILGIFQKNMPEHLEQLHTALQKQDEETVNHVIHKMLGMAHNVGALRLSEILMQLEHAEIAGKMSLTPADVEELRGEFATAAAALQQYLGRRMH